MKKYIPVVLFVFSCQVFSADIHGRGVRVLDGNTIDVMGNDSNLLIVFYVQIMPDDFVMQLHRF